MQKYKKLCNMYMHLQYAYLFKQQLCIFFTLIDLSHFVHKSIEIQLLKNNNEIFYVLC